MSKRSPDGPRRVTMSDVARRAGVSQPTVSFVLNDRRDVVVAEETRRRVLAAAAEMDFVPNRAAQHLRSNRSYLFGVVANGIVSQPYAGRIILGIQQVVQPADHLCLVIDTTDDPEQGDVAVA
ncbi:MAG TPA: LacI family DNA-binding transcriptional regulator, partial [Propionibacteriaceae bacterium]|nr:LacI family DNA-binding transcriptional regulator [Propionibacteriaceae bacterium]